MNMKKAMANQGSESGLGSGQFAEESKTGLKFNQIDVNATRNPFRLKAHSRKRFKSMYGNCE